MHDDDAEAIERSAGSDREVVLSDVRVVESEQLDWQPVELDLAPHVRQVVPPVCLELRDQLRSAPGPGAARLPLRAEVREVVEGPRHVVVVRAEHEPRCQPASDRRERLDGPFDRLGLSEEVAGHHGDVGARQAGEEPCLPLVASHEVQVAEVQNGERLGAVAVGR
ncbi:MAG TPA: hypothetical protein VJ979_10895 [Actinomycetota bacterium]|nr:hypothetical protein [Actinomycetota bacterium]